MSSVGIVGAGFAGLATAIKIKLSSPETDVVILEKPHRESNTQIAGMRLRERLPGKEPNSEELGALLASRNQGVLTKEMTLFAQCITQELAFWSELHTSIPGMLPLTTHDKAAWFGPQWGGGKGAVVLKWLQDASTILGVTRVEGTAVDVPCETGRVQSITVKDEKTKELFSLFADQYILANGSIGGALFHSTNKAIQNSAVELAFRSGIPLVGATTHMIHPFGRARPDGRALLGCYATDDLEGFTVMYPDGDNDNEITTMLREHTAHDYFPAITQKFWKKGGVVQLISPEGNKHWARVSHHYSQLGIQTSDGISVQGLENLMVAGDAGAWHLSNYATRFPGFGLSRCLFDAENIRQALQTRTMGGRVEMEFRSASNENRHNSQPPAELKSINTHHLLSHLLDQSGQEVNDWSRALNKLDSENILVRISKETARAHERLREGEIHEPYVIAQPERITIINEHTRELTPRSKKERK